MNLNRCNELAVVHFYDQFLWIRVPLVRVKKISAIVTQLYAMDLGLIKLDNFA